MKILWITNTVIGAMHAKLYGSPSSGLWMDALLGKFVEEGEHVLSVATTGRTKDTVICEEYGVTYYLLPGGWPSEYKCKGVNQKSWEAVLKKEKPDIIQVWGTEFRHGLAALSIAAETPSVIYMQGLLTTIARYYEAGIESFIFYKTTTLRDFLKRDSMAQQKRRYAKNAVYEKELLLLSGNAICENDWCDAHVAEIAPRISLYRCPLSINPVFAHYEWSLDAIERYSIICNASGYPIKGLHIVIRAFAIVLKRYPAAKLYIPGDFQLSSDSVECKLRKRGYTKYIENLIKKLDLTNNIIWLGRIDQNSLAETIAKRHVFILGSAIENHSSSLKEAMIIGIPSIAAAVGGIPEYVTHEEDGLLYRFEEYELLALYICRVFSDDFFAMKLSKNGKKKMQRLHNTNEVYGKMLNIYQSIIDEH